MPPRKRKTPQRVLGEQTEVLVQTGPAKRYKRNSRAMARRPSKLQKKENKFLDTVRNFTEFNYDATIVDSLNLIVQGDSINNRDGNRIKMTGIQVKGLVAIIPGAASVVQDVVFRLLLVYDKRPNQNGNPVIGDVLTTAGAASDVYQLRARAAGRTDRFKVLKDVLAANTQIEWGVPTVTQGPYGRYVIDWFIPIQALAEYGTNTAAATDLQVGNLVLIATSSLAAAVNGPALEYRARVSFEEI